MFSSGWVGQAADGTFGAGVVLRREEPVPGSGAHQLGLPLAPKRPRTMTDDYTRHGTVTLFAALSALEAN